jgi:hypothetical protein
MLPGTRPVQFMLACRRFSLPFPIQHFDSLPHPVAPTPLRSRICSISTVISSYRILPRRRIQVGVSPQSVEIVR